MTRKLGVNGDHIKALNDIDTMTVRAAEGNVLRFGQLPQFSPNSRGTPPRGGWGGGGWGGRPPHPHFTVHYIGGEEWWNHQRPVSRAVEGSVVTQRSAREHIRAAVSWRARH